jgi:hypothetical protein
LSSLLHDLDEFLCLSPVFAFDESNRHSFISGATRATNSVDIFWKKISILIVALSEQKLLKEQ